MFKVLINIFIISPPVFVHRYNTKLKERQLDAQTITTESIKLLTELCEERGITCIY